MAAKFTFGDKEYTFKRPVLDLTIKANELVTKSEVFDMTKAEKIMLARTDDEALFTKLNADWLAFCRLVFVEEVTDELALQSVVYPDEVIGAQHAFFSLPSEKLMARLKELNANLADSAANTKR